MVSPSYLLYNSSPYLLHYLKLTGTVGRYHGNNCTERLLHIIKKKNGQTQTQIDTLTQYSRSKGPPFGPLAVKKMINRINDGKEAMVSWKESKLVSLGKL